MEASVREAAGLLGVSANRVLQMIDKGDIDARMVSGRWLVDVASLPARRRPRGRPMSPRTAWALLLHDDPGAARWLGHDEAYRLRKRVDAWMSSPEPLEQMRAWLSARADAHHLHAQSPADVLDDARVLRSGWSDPRSGISAASYAEGYVHVDDIESVMRGHLLVEAPRGDTNVVLHVHESPLVVEPVPELLVIADLADRGGPREYARAEEMLAAWLSKRRDG